MCIRDRASPYKYSRAELLDLDVARKYSREVDGCDIDWTTFGEWMERVDRVKPGVNICPPVSYTHLDVYKRQDDGSQQERAAFFPDKRRRIELWIHDYAVYGCIDCV